MDANLLACPDHERLLVQLAESRALVDFTGSVRNKDFMI